MLNLEYLCQSYHIKQFWLILNMDLLPPANRWMMALWINLKLLPDSPVRITPFLQDIEDLAAAGADIIAVDGTNRKRPVDIKSAVEKIHDVGCLAMADCSNLEEGLYCQQLGFDIVGSTMSGYTGGEIPAEPDYQLVKDLKAAGCFVMAEGRYNTPELAKTAIEIGADAVTVGSALTRLEHIVSWFADAVKMAGK